jgi:hypothetical protein
MKDCKHIGSKVRVCDKYADWYPRYKNQIGLIAEEARGMARVFFPLLPLKSELQNNYLIIDKRFIIYLHEE